MAASDITSPDDDGHAEARFAGSKEIGLCCHPLPDLDLMSRWPPSWI